MWQSIPLTLFWFTYFGSLGIFYPYFSLYLRENAGLSGTELGIVLAISPLIGMIAQPFWGQVADRTGARSGILAWLTLGTALSYLVLGSVEGFWPIVVAMIGVALVGTAVFPIMISVSLAILRDAGRHAFGRVRVWGTVGFFALVLVFPWLLKNFPSRARNFRDGFKRFTAGARTYVSGNCGAGFSLRRYCLFSAQERRGRVPRGARRLARAARATDRSCAF